MYIPDEWEPAEWEEVSGRETGSRRFNGVKKSHRCHVPMGASGEWGVALSVPDMPSELDGDGNGAAKTLRKPTVPACVVVQAEAQAETEVDA